MIHGVNTNEDSVPSPYSFWETAITNGLKSAGYTGPINTSGVKYNTIFDKHCDNILIYGDAVAELLASVAEHAVSTPEQLGAAAQAPAQPGDGILNGIRWTAGMVAQWVVESDLRDACNDLLCAQIQQFAPDVIFAHSLGTLLCYDFFANDPRGKDIFAKGTLITFGTQIANTFIKDRMWGGNVEMIGVGQWYNLYNPNDPVFVASVDVAAMNFHQFTTAFGGGFLDETAHAVTGNGLSHPGYLDNPVTNANIWPALAGGTMASLIARTIKIMKRTPKVALRSSLLSLPRLRRKVHHTYRYHPPRKDHPLFKSAPKITEATAPAVAPASVDLRNFLLPIRDQGSEGACSGFSTAAFREASHAVATKTLLSDYLSPAYLYARTRMDDGTFPNDSGASIADEFLMLQNYGVCPESLLPYAANPAEAPTPTDDVAAVAFRIAQPIQVECSNPATIKSVLANNQTITIGFKVYESFENPDADGVVSIPNTGAEKLLGGHGVLVCGYDDTKSCWIIRNQWGQQWGANGYCFMPYGYETLWMEAWTGVPTP